MKRRIFAVSFAAIAVIAIIWMVVRNFGGAGTTNAPATTSSSSPDAEAVERAVNEDPPLSFAAWQSMIQESDDFAGLMEAAMRIGDPDFQNAVVASIIDRWLVVDPPGFIRHLNALEVGGDRDALAVVALALQDSLTRLSPEQASSDHILVVVQRLISYLASTDPEAALAWAHRFLLDDALESSLVSIARGMSRRDIEAGLQIAESINSPLRRSQAFAAVGTIWASKDAAAALVWAVSLGNHADRALTINSVLLVTAGQDPSAAALSLSEQAHIINDQYLVERRAELAALGISEADLLNDPESYREMLASGAIMAPSSPDIELMATAGKVIGSKLAEESPSAGLAWAGSLDGDFLSLTSTSGVLAGWATADPAGALAWVDENHPANIDLHASVYRSWASSDPGAAATAAQQIADSNQRTTILESVVKVWAAKGDAHEAAAFVGGLPPSESTDSARYALATTISYHEPEQAWQIAQGIRDESAQFRALKTAFSTMVARDQAAAANALESSDLPARTTERLAGVLNAVAVE